jgi:hypothetical protein
MAGTRRIFAGVSGSPGSVHALRQAAQLARHHDALLMPLLAGLRPDSRRLPWPELRQTAGPGQQPSPSREPATLPTGPSRAAGERTHRPSRARRGDWPSQQSGDWPSQQSGDWPSQQRGKWS